jgi:hypothetical protein
MGMNISLWILVTAMVMTEDIALDLAVQTWGPQARTWVISAPGKSKPEVSYCVGIQDVQPDVTMTPFGPIPNPYAGQDKAPVIKGCGPNWTSAFVKALKR